MQSDAEIYAQLIECLKKAEDCAKLLAVRKESKSWMKLSTVIGEVRDKLVELAKARIQ